MKNTNQNDSNVQQAQQPTSAPDSMMYTPSDHQKTPYWLLIVAVVVLVGLWFWLKDSRPQDAQPTPTESAVPEAQEIIDEIQNIDLGDLEAEFDAIDQDINSL